MNLNTVGSALVVSEKQRTCIHLVQLKLSLGSNIPE